MATVTAANSKRSLRTNYERRPLWKSLRPALASTVGSKYLVALTGLALTGFVLVHMTGNLLVFRGKDAVNSYALFLKDRGALLWAARLGLLAVFVLHVALAIRLQLRSRAARPTRYVHEDTVQATWASRYMLLTGLVVLFFLIFHLAHYTFGLVAATAVTPSGTVNYLDLTESYRAGLSADPAKRHDVYEMTIYGFRNVAVSIFYIVAQVFVGLHLYHGIASTFQSLGWNHPRFNRMLTLLGRTLAVILVVGNISMPLAVMTGFIGQDVPGDAPFAIWSAR